MLSFSGVYETLELHSVLSAAAGEGVFHYNYLMEIEVSSEHLAAGTVSRHRVLVMCSLEDGSLSLAIDDFPRMDNKIVEAFWIARVETHRRSREASFRGMELEWRQRHGGENTVSPSGLDWSADHAAVKRRSTSVIRTMLRDPMLNAAQKSVLRSVLDARWEKLEVLENHDEL